MTGAGQAGLQPRPHQVAGIAGIGQALAAADRAQLVSACGTGKTLTGRWHAQAAGSRVTVVFVPSLALVAQTLGEWRRAADAGWPWEALVVCSDPSTAVGAAERAAEEGGTVDHGFWSRARSGVTTSPALAAAALRRARRPGGGRLVVFSTYHSAPVVAAACKASRTVFDLMICDEAHRLAGRPGKAFRAVLDQQAIPARKRLFMTATPHVPDGDGMLSMGDDALFGPVAHTVTFAEAIKAGLLCDYQVLVIAGQQDGGGGHGAMTVPGAVLAAASDHHLRSLLSFHTYVKDAAAFATLLDGVTLRNGRVIRARHVSSAHYGAERARALSWLGEDAGGRELRLVSSARCLTEGVDVPGVDSVLFADPRKAVTGIIQAAGRALRAAPGKKSAMIIIPVTLPETSDGDDDTDLTVSRFGHVWAVLRALRAHDERFAAELDQDAAASNRDRRRTAAGQPRVRFLLPPGVALDEDLLRMRMVDAVTTDCGWERFYALLCGHAAAGGGFLPFNGIWEGTHLGKWAWRQVAAHKAGLLPAARKARLEAVPGWAWTTDGRHFHENLRRLRELAESTPGGLTQEPRGPSVYAGRTDSRRLPLGHRAADLRQQYRDGMLPAGQAEPLEAIPGWDWTGGLPAADVAMIQALRVYCEFEHHADVPEDYIEDGLPVGRWVIAVRRRDLTGRLHPALAEEIAAATPRDAKGAPLFKWARDEAQWRLAFAAVRQYAAREGTAARIPAYHAEILPDAKVEQLGRWVTQQRHRRRKGDLDPRHEAWLGRVPGWEWDPPGRRGDPQEPLDLGDDRWHGRAKGVAAGCKCGRCLAARRAADQRAGEKRAAERMLALGGAVPAGPARAHLGRLKRAGILHWQVADVSGVPSGVIREVAGGTANLIGAAHDALLRAVTTEMARAAPSRTGSRGRLTSVAQEVIPAGPVRELLADLDARGLGTVWVARELGYSTTEFLAPGATTVTRRVAAQVAALHERAAGVAAPGGHRTQKVPPLAELLRAGECG